MKQSTPSRRATDLMFL